MIHNQESYRISVSPTRVLYDPRSSSLLRFRKGLVDALNAEISLGTVANLRDASQWMGYTYLHVRMRKNPTNYGLCLEWSYPLFSSTFCQELPEKMLWMTHILAARVEILLTLLSTS